MSDKEVDGSRYARLGSGPPGPWTTLPFGELLRIGQDAEGRVRCVIDSGGALVLCAGLPDGGWLVWGEATYLKAAERWVKGIDLASGIYRYGGDPVRTR